MQFMNLNEEFNFYFNLLQNDVYAMDFKDRMIEQIKKVKKSEFIEFFLEFFGENSRVFELNLVSHLKYEKNREKILQRKEKEDIEFAERREELREKLAIYEAELRKDVI